MFVLMPRAALARLSCGGRLAVVGVLVALVAVGCGGQSNYTLSKTRDCLSTEDAKISPARDFVATTATGGAFRARFSDNAVTIAFGEKDSDAVDIPYAYEPFAFPNPPANILHPPPPPPN